jgi:nicotinamidase/pyrazinamidase
MKRDRGMIKLRAGDALLVVDVQRDFLPQGSLPVRDGDLVVPVLNRYIALALAKAIPVLACRDWHPRAHCSFKAYGGPWPEHCVADTAGAEFAPGLNLPANATIISKATRTDVDAYSAFGGNDLAQRLRHLGIKRVLIGGLTTDYCVLNSVRDALAAGFKVLVLRDAIRAVNVNPGDGERAEHEMAAAGASFIRFEDCAQ